MKKILVVDDQLLIRKIVLTVLKSVNGGVELDQCEHPYDALQMVRDTKYDLIFTDLVMPDMNGNLLIQAIRNNSLNGDTKICVLSGTTDQEELSESKALGANAFVLKPIKKEILLMVAEKLLD